MLYILRYLRIITQIAYFDNGSIPTLQKYMMYISYATYFNYGGNIKKYILAILQKGIFVVANKNLHSVAKLKI